MIGLVYLIFMIIMKYPSFIKRIKNNIEIEIKTNLIIVNLKVSSTCYSLFLIAVKDFYI